MSEKIRASKIYTDSIDHVTALIAAQVPVIWVVTYEEHRFITELSKSEKLTNHKVWYWSATSGIVSTYDEYNKAAQGSGTFDGTKPATKALDKIHEHNTQRNGNLVAIMRDFHMTLQDATARQIRDIYEQLANNGKTLLIVSPFLAHVGGGGIHPLLEKQIVVVDFTLPSHEEIVNHIKNILGATKDTNNKSELNYNDDEYRQIGRALQGLSITEIDNAVATSLAHLKKLDPGVLLQEKKQLVRKNQLLEFIDTDVDQDDVGGLDSVKEYLTRYGNIFTQEAESFGVEPLKGVIFTGIPGTGKSLLCKATSHLWKLPLLRLDVGKVMGKLVGQSEEQMRQAIATAESCAPCVTGDTVISTSTHGNLTAEQLHALLTGSNQPDKVLIETIDSNTGLLMNSEIHSVIRRSAKDKTLLQIQTSSGKKIKVTENHKLLIKTNSGTLIWKEAKDLTTEDDLVEVDLA